MPMMDSQRIAALSFGMAGPRLKVLILGGTGEARDLARAIAQRPEFDAMISLAGRTAEPLPQSVPFRIGGFGGIEGLRRYLQTETIDALIDATHPFAVQISAHAVAAAALDIPLLRIERAPWVRQVGDDWQSAPTAEAAAILLGHGRERAFLAMGKLEMEPFIALDRPVDPIPASGLPPHWTAITALGPFSLEDELSLFRAHAIAVMVTKNSGGAATFAKIEAARALHLPVIIIDRPRLPSARTVTSIEDAMDWLTKLHRGKLPTERAV
jgi:precorrin-6A/cobalt-precorrin-6A reductase